MKRIRVRKVVVGLAPAILAVSAVSGCNSSAPSVAPPPVSSSSSSTSQAVPTSPTTSSQPAVPTEASAPVTSANPAAMCTASQDGFGSAPTEAASTKKSAWGKPLDVTPQYEGTAAVTVQAPTASKPSSADSFGMTAGTQFLLFKVSAKYKSGPDVLLSGTDFTLVDTKHNGCDPDSLNAAVPQQDQFQEATLSNGSRSYSGTIIYDVPDGQNYRKYTLLYVPDSGGAAATAAWTG